jgi:hypothetical protein
MVYVTRFAIAAPLKDKWGINRISRTIMTIQHKEEPSKFILSSRLAEKKAASIIVIVKKIYPGIINSRAGSPLK